MRTLALAALLLLAACGHNTVGESYSSGAQPGLSCAEADSPCARGKG